MIAIVNIGSNLGNRRLNLARAVGAIINRFGAGYHLSHTVQTPAWGFESEKPFLNTCILFDTDLEAEELLSQLQEIEQHICAEPHRNGDGTYRDRMIDIDLIDYGRQVYSSDRLILPHPRMAQRRFVLEPLAEIAPGYIHPVTGLSTMEMLQDLKARQADE